MADNVYTGSIRLVEKGKPTKIIEHLILDASLVAITADNGIARFNGVTGVLQNSLATVDDNGGINIPTGQTYNINGIAHTHDKTHTIYTPVSFTETVSDGHTGDITGVQTQGDGVVLQVEEATGVPGFDIRFNFTGVAKVPQWIIYSYFYNGTATHNVNVELYNYVSPGFTALDSFVGNLANATKSAYLGLSLTNYMNSGAMIVRFNHTTTGNAAHVMYFGYVALVSEL